MGFFDTIGNIGRSVADLTDTAANIWRRGARMAFMPSKEAVLDMKNYMDSNPEKIGNLLDVVGTGAAIAGGPLGAGISAAAAVGNELNSAAQQQQQPEAQPYEEHLLARDNLESENRIRQPWRDTAYKIQNSFDGSGSRRFI